MAFRTAFPNANHLLCWLHSRINVEEKLTKLGIKNKTEFLKDIFGEKIGDKKMKGLADAESYEEFDEKWSELGKSLLVYKEYYKLSIF